MDKKMKIPYGQAHFETVRKNNFLYVDKTHFIEELEEIEKIIYLRPRRFGKSLFLSMLDCYYDVAKADQFEDLFGGLHIHENPTENHHHYYILRFDFSAMTGTTDAPIERVFRQQVWLDVERFINRYELGIELGERTTATAGGILETVLAKFENLKLGKKVYVMIDEYDNFTNSMLKGNASDFFTVLQKGGFIRSFYESMKKGVGSGIVERLFMTGVMSVSLDTMTSGFNIATNVTTDVFFADMMGFTSDEVKHLLQQLGLAAQEQEKTYEILRQNYNGYLFSDESETRVFNATLILYYLKYYTRMKRAPRELVDTNLNQSKTTIKNIVELKNKKENNELIKEIVQNKEVSGNLSTFIDLVEKFDKNDVITLLFNIGLLTIQKPGVLTTFKMPNKVIETIYFQYLSELAKRQAHDVLDVGKQEAAIQALGENGDIEPLTNLVAEFLALTSNKNTRKFDEKYIKLVYMMLLSSSHQFMAYDEFQAKQGFSDIVILKSPASYAKYEMIIELKYIQKGKRTDQKIESKFQEGIKQINDYMKDPRLGDRPDLKKFIVIFSGFDVVKLVEL